MVQIVEIPLTANGSHGITLFAKLDLPFRLGPVDSEIVRRVCQMLAMYLLVGVLAPEQRKEWRLEPEHNEEEAISPWVRLEVVESDIERQGSDAISRLSVFRDHRAVVPAGYDPVEAVRHLLQRVVCGSLYFTEQTLVRQ